MFILFLSLITCLGKSPKLKFTLTYSPSLIPFLSIVTFDCILVWYVHFLTIIDIVWHISIPLQSVLISQISLFKMQLSNRRMDFWCELGKNTFGKLNEAANNVICLLPLYVIKILLIAYRDDISKNNFSVSTISNPGILYVYYSCTLISFNYKGEIMEFTD